MPISLLPVSVWVYRGLGALSGSCLAERLGHNVQLTDGERAAIDALENDVRQVRRGTMVFAEGEPSRELLIVRKGWLQSGVFMPNGGRQITRVNLPGDIIGWSALAFDEAPETVVTLTDCTLCSVDRTCLSSLFAQQPRLGALLLALAVSERAELADRLASIGRTSARARVAALLCDIVARVRLSQGPDTVTLHVPLTQEEIGDATGLTAVHVNRMIRSLVEDGIIDRSGNFITLKDEARLIAEGNFTSRAEVRTDWLPAPR